METMVVLGSLKSTFFFFSHTAALFFVIMSLNQSIL